MDLASAEAEIRHVFGDTPITEASIGAAPPDILVKLSGWANVFKFGIQDGVLKGGRVWPEIRYFRMIKKQRNNKGRRKSCDNQRKRIYLVYNVFKAWRMQKSRRDVTAGMAVISPHICCLLNTEEGKNNAIYVL